MPVINVRQSYCARYSYRLDVCPSVCPSHAGIVSKRLNLSSNCLHCLVAPWFKFSKDQTFSRNSNANTPNGGVKCKGVEKSCNFRPISRYIARKRWKIDGYMLRCVWPALNPLSIHVTFTAGKFTLTVMGTLQERKNLFQLLGNCFETIHKLRLL